MSTKTPPGGAQPATPSQQFPALSARDAQLGHVYYLNGDAVQVTQKDEDGAVRVQMVTDWKDGKPASLGCRAIRLPGNRELMRTTTLPALEDGAPPSASSPIELPNGLTGTPKPNPGGHLDRARIEEALPTMTEEQLTELLDRDRRTFVGSLVNNERERRERAAKAPKPQTAPPPAPPRVSATTSASPPRGMTVASAPPSYPSPLPQPKTPRAPKAAPTPPAAPAAPAVSPSLPNDDRAARARAAWAVLSKNTPALLECAEAYKELEALGLTAPRFM